MCRSIHLLSLKDTILKDELNISRVCSGLFYTARFALPLSNMLLAQVCLCDRELKIKKQASLHVCPRACIMLLDRGELACVMERIKLERSKQVCQHALELMHRSLCINLDKSIEIYAGVDLCAYMSMHESKHDIEIYASICIDLYMWINA